MLPRFDQGSQFTSDGFTDILITKGIAMSMDGKGSWRDNVFVERFWRTLKYEGGLSQGLRERRGGALVDPSEHPSLYVVEENRFC